MSSQLSHYLMLARRWAWLVILGVVLCGGGVYIISKRMPPVYQAAATVIININSSSSVFDNINASEQIAPTYAQLLTSAKVLGPVLAQHPELTQVQLKNMVSTKFQDNTTLIEIDVDNNDPGLAVQLANEIAQSFSTYAAGAQLPGSVSIIPAEEPINPIQPKPSLYGGIGALVGLGLALSLIIIFEWLDDRLKRPEEVQELLGKETLAIIPRLRRDQRAKSSREPPAVTEAYRLLGAGLKAAQLQKPFKSVMITSALPGEGKSTVAASLASFLATSGMHVLLVDADLRHPVQQQRLKLDAHCGLSDIFLDLEDGPQVELDGQETDIPGLRVLTAGRYPADPSALLQSSPVNRFFDQLKKAPFDYVVFDTSPLLPVADARILASHVQAVVLVVDGSKTPRGTLRKARQVLARLRTDMVGVVINNSSWREDSESRRYLRKAPRPRREISMPPVPETPPAEHNVEEELTIKLNRLL